jgi:type IV pilus assembly protein PilM
MFGFVQNIFAPPAHPIGVDFGTDSLRLAQVQSDGDDFKLLAAASAEVPANVREDALARLEFFADSAKHLLGHGKFHGHRAVLGLPSSIVQTQHLTIEAVEESKLKEAVFSEAKHQFSLDPAHALLRYAVAGEIDGRTRPQLHVVLMAADAHWVNQYIAAARKAKLDVVAMNMQPLALLDCFASIYRRTSEQKSVRMYVDIGSSGTRAAIAQGTQLLFLRNLPVGGDHLTAAVAEALGISIQNAKTLRLKVGAGGSDHEERVDAVCMHGFKTLAKHLDLCRDEHEANFPELRVQRLIFVGGEARLESLCEHISEQLKIPGQTGDSLCRMARNSRIGIESAIDRRHPQPGWAAAIGLSMGPPHHDK